jgi:hypothetical protein
MIPITIKISCRDTGKSWLVPAWKIASLKAQAVADERVGKFGDLPFNKRAEHNEISGRIYNETVCDRPALVSYCSGLAWEKVAGVAVPVQGIPEQSVISDLNCWIE